MSLFAAGASIYSAKQSARCLVPHVGDTGHHRFLLGTTALRQKNSIHLLRYDEERAEVSLEKIFRHEKEIWSLSSCPTNRSLVFTAFTADGSHRQATLWRMPGLDNASALDHSAEPAEAALEQRSTLPDGLESCISVGWNPSAATDASGGKAYTLHANKLRVWDVNSSGDKLSEISSVDWGDGELASIAAWNPHHPTEICIGGGSGLRTYDLRTSNQAQNIKEAHGERIRDIDYNPNRPFALATCGDDCRIRFWDMRKTERPIKDMQGHSHWVWSVRYNRFHDQLVLSSGSDSVVNLWRVSSISSAPLLEMEEANSELDVSDVKVKSYEEHEDSVYAVAWSAMDAWVFMSLSFNGRVVVNQVPSTEKYKILL